MNNRKVIIALENHLHEMLQISVTKLDKPSNTFEKLRDVTVLLL